MLRYILVLLIAMMSQRAQSVTVGVESVGGALGYLARNVVKAGKSGAKVIGNAAHSASKAASREFSAAKAAYEQRQR